MNTSMDKMKKYMCMDTVITAAGMYIIMRFVPGPEAIAQVVPIPGFSGNVSVGQALIAFGIATMIAKPIAEKWCKSS